MGELVSAAGVSLPWLRLCARELRLGWSSTASMGQAGDVAGADCARVAAGCARRAGCAGGPFGAATRAAHGATWLDHAGVSPKVASQLMGHKTPEYQQGAAAITLRRYTHTLPGELERARDLLDDFIARRVREEAAEA